MIRDVAIAAAGMAAGVLALSRWSRRKRGLRMRRMRELSSLRNPPLPKAETEERILSVLDSISKAGKGWQSVPANDGRMLRLLTETAGARKVVEIGTSTGFSGLWICLALQATGGKLITFEADPRRIAVAREHFKQAGVDHIVSIIEGDAHSTISELTEPIDVLFLDAEKEGYLDYLDKLLPMVRPGGLVLAHNVTMVSGYGVAITTNPDLETVLYMEGAGLGITLKKR